MLTKHRNHWIATCEQTADAIAKKMAVVLKKNHQIMRDGNAELLAGLHESMRESVDSNRHTASDIVDAQGTLNAQFAAMVSAISEASADIRTQLEAVRPVCEANSSDLRSLKQEQQEFVDSASLQIEQLSRASEKITGELERASEKLSALSRAAVSPRLENSLEAIAGQSAETNQLFQRITERMEQPQNNNHGGFFQHLFGRRLGN